MFWQHDDNLFPNNAPLGSAIVVNACRKISTVPTYLSIVDIMNFIEYDKLEVSDQVGSAIEHTS